MKNFLRNTLRWLIVGAVALVIAACYGVPIQRSANGTVDQPAVESGE